MADSRVFKEALLGAQRIAGYGLLSALQGKALRWLYIRGVLREILSKLRVNCVLDVGANRGQFGTHCRRLGYKGWILSFEPVRASFEELEKVAGKSGPWRVFPYALGSANCQMAINVTRGSHFSSFLVPREDSMTTFPENMVERTEEVTVQRLDDVLEDCISGIPSPRIFMKMDTQGFDMEVLRGSDRALSRIVALQTEVSFKGIYDGMPNFAESIQECQSRGFEVMSLLPVNSERFYAVEMDCILARRQES